MEMRWRKTVTIDVSICMARSGVMTRIVESDVIGENGLGWREWAEDR